jgi:predicted ferric reductase
MTATDPPRPRPALRPAPTLTAIAAGGLAVIWLWWRDQPADLSDLGGWLTGAGRITGLLAGYAVAVQLLLMSRSPLLDRGVGTDRLARWHAAGGQYAVGLMVAHTVLITWGYAASTHEGVIRQAGTLLTSYPDMLMATAALGLFALIALVSIRAARRRFRYETWYYLHLYTYLALALAFAHVFADGNEFRSDTAARIGWSALYIATGLVLFTYRVAVPVRNALRHRLRVVAVRPEAPGITSLHITGRDLAALRPQPGQFFRWRFLTRDGWWQSHPFSLSEPPARKLRRLRITVKALGDYTTALQRVRPGTRVIAEGPYGAVTPAARGGRKVVLLAGGVGITAIRALAEAFARGAPAGGRPRGALRGTGPGGRPPGTPGGAPQEAVLLYRVNQESEIAFRAELDALARRGALDVRYLAGPPGSAADVLIGGRLAAAVPDIVDRDAFVCGPPGFVTAATAALRRAGIPAARIHAERFEF